jgi:hypothetical protein
MPAATKKSNLLFLGIIIGVHLAFFLLAWYYKNIFNGDSSEYIYMAFNIKEHSLFYSANPALPAIPEFLTLRTPGYSLMLMLIYSISINNWLVLIVQNLLSIFNIYYLRNSMKLIGYNSKYDWLLLLFIILFPSQFINANIIAPDILLQTCILIYFRYFILFMQEKTGRHVFGMSAALIAGLFVKPVLYPFAFLHCIIILLVLRKTKQKLAIPFSVAILPACAVLLYSTWNYQRTGKFHFTSTQSFNALFYHYTYFAEKQGTDSAIQFISGEREKMDAFSTFRERYDYANNRGAQLLLDNFTNYVPFTIKKALSILVTPGKGEMDLFTGRLTLSQLYDPVQKESLITSIRKEGIKGFQKYVQNNPSFHLATIVLLFNFLRLLGFSLFLIYFNTDGKLKLLIALLVCYFIFLAGPIANVRYLIPVSLIIIGCACLSFQQLLQRRSKSINIT